MAQKGPLEALGERLEWDPGERDEQLMGVFRQLGPRRK
jgi:hypothetical protein